MRWPDPQVLAARKGAAGVGCFVKGPIGEQRVGAKNGSHTATRQAKRPAALSGSRLRWSVKRELYTAFRSNAVDEGEVWVPFERSVRNHAVCKRMAFEQLAWMTVPLATVHQTETIDV